jgi:hypothetical protein
MQRRRILPWLMPVLVGLAGACSSGFSTATDAVTGRPRLYALGQETALRVAHDAMAQSFPDRAITPLDPPEQGFSAHAASGLGTSTQVVVIHPVTGVTASGATLDGYTFEVSGRGTISASDIATASFFAELQQALDATGDSVDVARIAPRTQPP